MKIDNENLEKKLNDNNNKFGYENINDINNIISQEREKNLKSEEIIQNLQRELKQIKNENYILLNQKQLKGSTDSNNINNYSDFNNNNNNMLQINQ